MLKNILPHIALFLSNTIYAINYIVAKDVMPHYLEPRVFVFIRVAGAAIIFSYIHFFFIKEKVQYSDIFRLFLCALLGVVINMNCFFMGLSITSSINASLIMITTPIIVYVLSMFFLRERSAKKAMGVILGFIGSVVLITDGGSADNMNSVIYGDILVLINATSYAFYLILVKSLMSKYHPLTVLKFIFLIGFVLLCAFSFKEIQSINFSQLPLNIFLKIGYVIFFTTCCSYFLNIYAISKVKASTVALYIYLQPLLATLISVSLGREELLTTQIISAVCIVIGVYLVIKRNA